MPLHKLKLNSLTTRNLFDQLIILISMLSNKSKLEMQLNEVYIFNEYFNY